MILFIFLIQAVYAGQIHQTENLAYNEGVIRDVSIENSLIRIKTEKESFLLSQKNGKAKKYEYKEAAALKIRLLSSDAKLICPIIRSEKGINYCVPERLIITQN